MSWPFAKGKKGFQWDRSESGGRTFYTLKSLDFGLELSYTYSNGYLIAGPSRALIDRAVKYHDSGYTLLHSPRFVAALPEDKQANFSALIYQNLASGAGRYCEASRRRGERVARRSAKGI